MSTIADVADAQRLLNDFGIYVQPVNYPSVAIGTARLRVTPTPLHPDAEAASLSSTRAHQDLGSSTVAADGSSQ
ncbi:MAG: aminotransferase class I/II-fold pyridoxal phosphate-dependent enzyme [Novosphingobium sp.]